MFRKIIKLSNFDKNPCHFNQRFNKIIGGALGLLFVRGFMFVHSFDRPTDLDK